MSSVKFEDGEVLRESELANYAEKARKSAGLNQTEAGKVLGVDQARISHAENPTSDRNEIELCLRIIEEFTDFSIRPLEREFKLLRDG